MGGENVEMSVPVASNALSVNDGNRERPTSTYEYFTEDPKGLEKSGKAAQKFYEHKKPGPVTKRSCRDVCCGFIFLQYWLIMFAIAYYAIGKGQPLRLLYAMDAEGGLCGQNNTNGRDLTSMPYLFYFDMTNPFYGYSRCVTNCPNFSMFFDLPVADPTRAICKYDFPQPDIFTLSAAVGNESCASLVVTSTPVVSRCFPDASSDFNNSDFYTSIQTAFVQTLNEQGFSFEIQRDLYAAWPVLLMCAALSVVLSFLWIVVLQMCAGVMVYTTILMFVLVTAGAMAYLWFNYYRLATGQTIISPDIDIPWVSTETLNSYANNKTTFLAGGIIMTVFSVLCYLALIFLRKRISLAVVVIKIASRAVRALPLLVILPILKVFWLLVLSTWFVYILVNLATAGEVKELDFVGFYVYQSDYILEYMQLYYLFGFLWTWNLIIAMGDCTIAGSVGTWYWTMNKKKLPKWIIAKSTYRVFRYHLGSLAFGSFIIALIQFIRYLLYKAEKKLKGQENAFLKTLFKILQCFFLCFERFLKFINKNAYIEIAVYGYSFCKAAKWAFQLITRNVVRVVVVNKLADFLLLIGKFLITFLVGIAGNILIEYFSSQPTYWITPMIVILMFAFGTAYVFTAVIDMSVSTIFLCFCEDLERNDGSADKPYYMDPKLKKYIDKDARAQSDLASPAK